MTQATPKAKLTIAVLLETGLRQIKDDGTAATQVAGALLHEHYGHLTQKERRDLASVGLARMLNDAMAEERSRAFVAECQARYDKEEMQQQEENRRHDSERQEWQERRRQRDEESRQRWMQEEKMKREALSRLNPDGDAALHLEIARLHAATGCQLARCTRSAACHLPYLQAACLGNALHALTKPLDGYTPAKDLGALAYDFLQLSASEQEETVSRLYEAKAIHERMGCSSKLCSPDSSSYLISCVRRHVTSYPTEEWAARIDLYRTACEQEKENHSVFHAGLLAGFHRALQDMKSIMLVSSDGTMKSLCDFSQQDVAWWQSKAASSVDGWGKRLEWFAAAAQMLIAAEVKCISELPSEQISTLAELARTIWKNGDGELAG